VQIANNIVGLDTNALPQGEHLLYNSEVRVSFNAELHRYQVSDIRVDGGRPCIVPSVTTILSAMLAKPHLQSWALKLAAQSMIAAFQPNRPYQATDIQRMAWLAVDAGKRATAEAGATGAETHHCIEAYLRQRNGENVQALWPQDSMAQKCFLAAINWLEANNVRMLHAEKILYSRAHRVIGTMDLAGLVTVNGRSAVIDYKTSNRLAPSMRLQLAAYQAMYAECFGINLQDRWLLRLDKETGDCEPVKLSVETARGEADAFFKMVEAYRALSELKFFEEAA
jgi:hypothetical protein